MSAMTPWEFAKCLVKAGVVTQEEASAASRIVIDCSAGSTVQVYVQRHGDAGALRKLAPMLAGMLPAGEETAQAQPLGGLS